MSQLWSWSSVFLFRGDGGQSALELGGGVIVGFFVSGGRGLVSFRGCEGGTGASQLWSCELPGLGAVKGE